MCLGIPGQIVAITDHARQMAMADVSGVRREVSLAPVALGPLEALVGQWALIHVGFAMAIIDEDEAAHTLAALRDLRGMVVLSGYPSRLYDDALAEWRRVERKALADGARQRTEVLWLNAAAADELREAEKQPFLAEVLS